MSQEARPDLHPLQRGPQPTGVHRRQLKALDKELLGFLHTHLGGLLDMWVHELGQAYRIDRILIEGIELGKNTAKDCPHDIGRQPWNSLRLEESLSQGRLAHPGRATNEIQNAARHDIILSSRPARSAPDPRGEIGQPWSLTRPPATQQ
jgi:hypothetical protein